MNVRRTAWLALAAGMVLGGCGQDLVAPSAKLTEAYAAKKFFEAPVWDPAGGKLYFDAYEKVDRLVRLDGPDTVAEMPDTDGIGGTFLGRDGRLLGADCLHHAIVSYAITPTGLDDRQVLASDPSWHQPNDLCQTPSGDIYFTDPDFNGKRDGAVYRLAPGGRPEKVLTSLPCPNGIIASPDGSTLYVSDTHFLQWWAFPILPDGTLGEGRRFFEPTSESKRAPDGMTVDERGNVYCTGLGGVWIVSPAGKKLHFVAVPEFCSNVAFGGGDGKTLYITCGKKVYSLAMRVRGAGL